MTRPRPLQAARRFAASAPEAQRFVIRAWLCVPLVRASLAAAGLQATLRWIEAIPTAPRRPGRVGVAEAERLIDGVFRHHFVSGECLPRSLLQYLLHRRDSLPVRLVVGVRRDTPASGGALAAHAWVEAASGPGATAATGAPTRPGVPDEPWFAPIFVTGAA
jgi:hypothetical protein